MRIITWNMSGWAPQKIPTLNWLLRQCDALCLTEIWCSPDEYAECIDGDIYHVQASPVLGMNRGHGGAAIVIPKMVPFKLKKTHSADGFQTVIGSLFGHPIACVYIRPAQRKDQLLPVYDFFSKNMRGNVIITGDFNARSVAWDRVENTSGTYLSRWAAKSNLTIAAPKSPTSRTPHGSSIIDLVLTRNIDVVKIGTFDFPERYGHAPVQAKLQASTFTTVEYIPLSIYNNQRCRKAALDFYKERLPQVCNKFDQARTPIELTKASGFLSEIAVTPFAAFQKPRPNRFRPGWTWRLDRMAKKRTKLYKKGDDISRRKAKILDQNIKKQFTQNVHKLQDQVGDELASARPGTEAPILKRLLALTQTKAQTISKVDPDKYTQFMQSLQPPKDTAPDIRSFDVPNSFEEQLQSAIVSAHKSKAPGPDKLRVEALQVAPDLFAKCLLSLMRAVGRIRWMPNLLRSAILSPVYKDKGDPTDPSNNRPVALVSPFRKVIGIAVRNLIRSKHKNNGPNLHQFGFQKNSNTECAIAYTINSMRHRFPHAVFLDIKKAYDMVTKYLLDKQCQKVLPPSLADLITALLAPIFQRTKGQQSSLTVRTTAGLGQGFPESQDLFNIFMDPFLEMMNCNPREGQAILFADDVVIMAALMRHLQNMLNGAAEWGTEYKMTWAVAKCHALSLPGPVYMNGQQIPSTHEAAHLGVTIRKYGVSDARLLNRIKAAFGKLCQIRRVTKEWHTDPARRRGFVKSFVYSICDYLLYMQPMSANVQQAATNLDRECASFVIGARCPPTQFDRGMALSRLLPMRLRRKRHMTKALTKFKCLLLNDKTSRTQLNYNAISSYSTIATAFDTKPPDKIDDIINWKKHQLRSNLQNAWPQANKHKRQIPIRYRNKLPPVLDTYYAKSTVQKAGLFYFNHLRFKSLESKQLLPQVTELMAKDHLTDDEELELEQLLTNL